MAKRKLTKVLMRQIRGNYIIEDPSHPEYGNVLVVGWLWKTVVAKAEKLFNITLPKGPPPGACALVLLCTLVSGCAGATIAVGAAGSTRTELKLIELEERVRALEDGDLWTSR